ncbi:hypothetical protein [Kitasatospora sp. NPDC002040]|uniref:hypothetical protein n=1 Tax=Kitasatospora sp. NPDC002040 TaxID=3154661 RepID=UPI0033185E95
MTYTLPGPLVPAETLTGATWPQADEDNVFAYARGLQTFVTDVSGTQRAADQAVLDLGQGYHGGSYDAMVQFCSRTTEYVSAAVDVAAAQMAVALDGAAQTVYAAKATMAQVLLDLTKFILVGTITLRPDVDGAVLYSARTEIDTLFAKAEQGLLKLDGAAQALETAAAPSAGDSPTGTGPAGATGGVGSSFGADPGYLTDCANRFRRFADDVANSRAAFNDSVAGLPTGPGGVPLAPAIDAAEGRANFSVNLIAATVTALYQQTADRLEQVVANLSETEQHHTKSFGRLAGQL